MKRMKKLKKIDPLDIVHEQFRLLKEKLNSARDANEKKVLARRLVNLVGVIQFLLSINKNS